MCLQNLFCSLEHVYQERKKKVLSLLTIYFLVTASRDLELDEQMDFPEGLRLTARVCVYLSMDVANSPYPSSCAGLGEGRGDSVLWTSTAPKVYLPGERWATGCQKVSRALRCMSQFHLLASGCSN